jgi:hypothetical protein
MLEKIFVLLLIIFIVSIVYYDDHTYNNNLKEYYYCTPYNIDQDPVLPPLTHLELKNFEEKYVNFNANYNCQIKFYTSKQFHIMRKARK